jgi:hypothetical protein
MAAMYFVEGSVTATFDPATTGPDTLPGITTKITSDTEMGRQGAVSLRDRVTGTTFGVLVSPADEYPAEHLEDDLVTIGRILTGAGLTITELSVQRTCEGMESCYHWRSGTVWNMARRAHRPLTAAPIDPTQVREDRDRDDSHRSGDCVAYWSQTPRGNAPPAPTPRSAP